MVLSAHPCLCAPPAGREVPCIKEDRHRAPVLDPVVAQQHLFHCQASQFATFKQHCLSLKQAPASTLENRSETAAIVEVNGLSAAGPAGRMSRQAGFSRLGMGGHGLALTPCLGDSSASVGRFGSARQVWPAQRRVKHPSLGYAALINAARFSYAGGGGPRKGGGGGGKGGDDKDDVVINLIDKYGDRMAQLTFSSVVGFSSGYAMMKVGKAGALLIGVSFITIQALNQTGVINVQWKKVEDKAMGLLDTNMDNKIDKEDVKNLWKRLKNVLTHNLPAGGGFVGGFALGLYCG